MLLFSMLLIISKMYMIAGGVCLPGFPFLNKVLAEIIDI